MSKIDEIFKYLRQIDNILDDFTVEEGDDKGLSVRVLQDLHNIVQAHHCTGEKIQYAIRTHLVKSSIAYEYRERYYVTTKDNLPICKSGPYTYWEGPWGSIEFAQKSADRKNESKTSKKTYVVVGYDPKTDSFREIKLFPGDQVSDIKDFVDSLADWYGVTLTHKQAKEVIESTAGLAENIKQFGMDTCVREWAIDAVGQYIGLKGHWPLGKDTESYTQAYFAAFKEKAALKGIKLRPDWMGAL